MVPVLVMEEHVKGPIVTEFVPQFNAPEHVRAPVVAELVPQVKVPSAGYGRTMESTSGRRVSTTGEGASCESTRCGCIGAAREGAITSQGRTTQSTSSGCVSAT